MRQKHSHRHVYDKRDTGQSSEETQHQENGTEKLRKDYECHGSWMSYMKGIHKAAGPRCKMDQLVVAMRYHQAAQTESKNERCKGNSIVSILDAKESFHSVEFVAAMLLKDFLTDIKLLGMRKMLNITYKWTYPHLFGMMFGCS